MMSTRMKRSTAWAGKLVLDILPDSERVLSTLDLIDKYAL